MNYLCIGRIVNTHGIKGEIKISSEFLFKDVVFKKGRKFYIGENKEMQIMETYRVHKIFDMITFKGINNINDVLKYKGEPIFINRDDVKFPDYLDEELIGLDVWSDRYCGFVYDVIKTKTGRILEVHKEKVHLVPYHKAFVKKVDLKKKIIKIEEIKGLIDED